MSALVDTSIADEHSLSARIAALAAELDGYDQDGVELDPVAVQCLTALLRDFTTDAAMMEAELRALRPVVVARPRPLLRDIIAAVAFAHGLSLDEILSDSRSRQIARPRQIVYWLARELTSLSCVQIGRRMLGRDHSTIVSGIRQIDRLMAHDPGFRRRIDKLAERIRAEAPLCLEAALQGEAA